MAEKDKKTSMDKEPETDGKVKSTNTSKEKLPKKRMSKKKKRQLGKVIMLAVLLVVMILLAGVMLVMLFVQDKYARLDKISIISGDLKFNDLDSDTREVMSQYRTIALFGLDNRSNGNFKSGNSDTIIIASINEETGEIKMVSVYRDTYLKIADNSFNKANAAYNRGGPKQAIEMLNENFDLNITDYVSVDFNALVTVIDELGGIELDITGEEAGYMTGYIDEINEMTRHNSGYVSRGTQTVDGVQATAYARVRYTAGWDYRRTERQRSVITKIFEKAKKADLMTLNRILDKVLPKISTSLELTELLSLAADAGKYSMGDSAGFPFERESATIGKLSYMVVAVDFEENVRTLHEFLFSNEEYTPSRTVRELSETMKEKTGY